MGYHNRSTVRQLSFVIRTLVLTTSLMLASAVWGREAAVAMPDRYSAEVAMNVLEQGGNAVDAAVAAGFVLAVTFPEAGNIGGGGFMLTWFDKKADFLDYRETAPAKATRDMYLDNNGEFIRDASLIGGQAAGTPGTVAGMWAAHQKYGSIAWEKLLAPAIELAEKGFIVAPDLARKKDRYINWIKKISERQPNRVNFGKWFGGMKAGQLFRQPDLAKTLKIIAKLGARGFYQGDIADKVARQMAKSGGLVTTRDLADYKAIWRQPLAARWRQYQVLSAPPPSSGGFGVIQLLKMKAFLDPLFKGVKHNSAQYIHLTAEMEKRVYADRAMHLGDPDFYPVPIDLLMTDEYIKKRAAEVNPTRISATESVKPGAEGMHTTHYSIVDAAGNAVANTYTLNTSFGCGVVVEGAGFLMNNEMDDFSAKPGVPNIYGVIGHKANEIAPGKRMLSSMSPTILLEGDRVKMVVGTPGGSTIITSVYQTIVNAIDYGMTVDEAVAAARFHHQLLPKNLIRYHQGIAPEIVNQLRDKGYDMREVSYLGYVQAVLRSTDGLQAAADQRGRGKALVRSIR